MNNLDGKSDQVDRHIEREDHGVSVEFIINTPEMEETNHMTYRFDEVLIYNSGWVEGINPKEEPKERGHLRRDFFPPEQIVNIVAYEEIED